MTENKQRASEAQNWRVESGRKECGVSLPTAGRGVAQVTSAAGGARTPARQAQRGRRQAHLEARGRSESRPEGRAEGRQVGTGAARAGG